MGNEMIVLKRVFPHNAQRDDLTVSLEKDWK